MKERLIELIKSMKETPEITCPRFYTKEECKGCEFDKGNECDVAGREANYLLANGVIVPKLNIGTMVYSVKENSIRGIPTIATSKIRKIVIMTIFEIDIGKTVFPTKEEAESKLKGGI